jgi:hypothetical protein
MLMMVEQLDKTHYSPRVYVTAATDRMSGTKALTKEQAWSAGGKVGTPGNVAQSASGRAKPCASTNRSSS